LGDFLLKASGHTDVYILYLRNRQFQNGHDFTIKFLTFCALILPIFYIVLRNSLASIILF